LKFIAVFIYPEVCALIGVVLFNVLLELLELLELLFVVLMVLLSEELVFDKNLAKPSN